MVAGRQGLSGPVSDRRPQRERPATRVVALAAPLAVTAEGSAYGHRTRSRCVRSSFADQTDPRVIQYLPPRTLLAVVVIRSREDGHRSSVRRLCAAHLDAARLLTIFERCVKIADDVKELGTSRLA